MAESKRNAIVEAAADLFCTNGFYETKIIEIARAAGVGKGTVYEYFDSKSDILAAVVERLYTNYSSVAPLILAEKTTYDRLEKYIEFNAKFLGMFKMNVMTLQENLQGFGRDMPNETKTMFSSFIRLNYVIVKWILEGGIARGELSISNPAFAAAYVVCNVSSFLLLKEHRDELNKLVEAVGDISVPQYDTMINSIAELNNSMLGNLPPEAGAKDSPEDVMNACFDDEWADSEFLDLIVNGLGMKD